MDTYSILREFADSWMLLTLFTFFLAVVVWAFRPGSRQTHQTAATAIFRHDSRPATLHDAGPARPGQEG
jgi:cytochrome c oxidase cbb3-type subunit 4